MLMRKLYNWIPLILFTVGISFSDAEAQASLQVKGTVTSKEGPIPGVSVQVKGTNSGVSTDANGEYAIQLENENATLVFSFIGFATQEVSVGGKTQVDVELSEDVTTLTEVI